MAACLCIIGFWHVRQNSVPLRPLLGRVVFYALAAMMVAGGAVHALWVPRGLAIKYADTVGGYAPELIAALRRYWKIAYDLAAVPAYFGAILLAILVVLGKRPLSALDGAGELRASVAIWPRWPSGLLLLSVPYWSGVLRIFR